MINHAYIHYGVCLVSLLSTGLATNGVADDITRNRLQKCEQLLSLEEFRAFSLNNSPLVAEIDRDYAEELAIAFETETLQNPELQVEKTFTGMNIGGANDPQSQVSIAQPLRISNFGSRSEVAKLIRKSGDLEKKVKLMELVQRFTLQYETLAAYQQIKNILTDSENKASKKVSVIKEGVKKGLLSDGDEHLFEGEKYRLQAEIKSIDSSILVLRNELSKSIGYPCKINATFIKAARSLPSEKDLIVLATESQISESARIDILMDLTKEQVKLSELDAYPSIAPRIVYQHTNDGGDFIGAGFSIPLPLWNRNQGQRYKASAERKVAEIRSSFIKNGGLENQISTIREAIASSEEQAELFNTKVISSFEKAFQSQERMYTQGKGNVLQVWQTLRAFNEVRTQGLQLLLEAKMLRIQLSILIGEEI